MSYFGESIYIGNQTADKIIAELTRLKEKYPNKEIVIGHRICLNNCDFNRDQCECSIYNIEINPPDPPAPKRKKRKI